MPLSCDADYAVFLTAQFAAREAIDRALDAMPPMALAAPPLQTALIENDLRDLGFGAPSRLQGIRLDDRHEALGAAWVVAGSSLGNRAILARRKKAGLAGADRFLADGAMPAYFRQVLEIMETSRSPSALAAAIKGAHKAFALFETAFDRYEIKKAA